MSRAEDHSEEAEHCLDAVDVMRDNDVQDSMAHAALAGEATAHALLALVEKVGELVEQQRIANIIAAMATDSEDGLIYIEDQAAAEVYVRDHISGLVSPDTGSGDS